MLYSKIKFEDTKRVSESVSQSTDNTMDKRYQRGIRIRKSNGRGLKDFIKIKRSKVYAE